MRLSFVLLTATAARCLAEETTKSPLEVAISQYPQCALTCLLDLVPHSACQLTDLDCQCTNTELNDKIGVCVKGGCSTFDALKTQNVSATMCGHPVRDESAVPGIIAIAGGVVALFAWLLRVWVTCMQRDLPVGWDDYTIAAAVALAVPPTVFAPILGANGMGRDIWTLTPQHAENVLFYYYLGELFYFAAMSMIKISILCFLLRVFPRREFRRLLYMAIVLCSLYGILFIFVTAFQCTPIEHTWLQLDSSHEGHCMNISLQAWMSAILNIVLDVMILLLPLKDLWALQLSLKKKLMLMFMFSLGIFVTVISVIRLRVFIVFATSINISYDYSAAGYWSTVELHAGILCACLPSLRKLFISLGATMLGSTRSASKAMLSGKNGSRLSRPTQGTLDDAKGQPAPRVGDESDFIPLVDVEIGVAKAPYGSYAEKSAKDDNRIRATTTVTTGTYTNSDVESNSSSLKKYGRF